MSVGAPQQVLSGKYRLERELGRGGMGSVWLAQHLTLRSPVAIKLIDAQIAQNAEALGRFLREAQAAAALRSPHVVQILDHGVDAGVPFIVMELLEGESLASRLERLGRMPPEETARVLTQVARAMTKAHDAGVVHRDLKPDNIFLVRNDEEELAKVLDFGIAKSQSHGIASVSSATRTGSVLGTPYYMSPEQAEGAKSVDHRTDVWAMGVIACECLVGARPFDAETLGALLLAICAREMPVPSRLGPVPPGFDAWFARACARDVSQRFSSAKQAAQELRIVCTGTGEAPASYVAHPTSGHGAVPAASLPLASTTAHLSVSSSSSDTRKKSSAPWGAVGLGALAVLGLGGFVWLRGHGPEETPSATGAPRASSASLEVAPLPPPSTPPAPVRTVEASAPAAVSAAPPAPPVAPRVGAKPRTTAAAAPANAEKPKTVTPPASPPPAATPPPTAKPRVNLGI